MRLLFTITSLRGSLYKRELVNVLRKQKYSHFNETRVFYHKLYKLSIGEPTSIILEHLFADLFLLKDRFEALGMTIKDGKVYLADIEELHND